MTLTIAINAALSIAALTGIVVMIGWAIRTADRDRVRTAARRPVRARARARAHAASQRQPASLALRRQAG